MLTAILFALFIGYSYTTMMDSYQSKAKCFFKGIGVFIVGQLLFFVVLMLLMALTISIWVLFDQQGVKEFFGS